ncbi:MAG: hypothetical protein K6V73_10935 [Firmicutes bacterium]|nr:hypothetical protein [Bacillota bacterium]
MTRTATLTHPLWAKAKPLLQRENIRVFVTTHALANCDARLVIRTSEPRHGIILLRPGMTDAEAIKAILTLWAQESWFGAICLFAYLRQEGRRRRSPSFAR